MAGRELLLPHLSVLRIKSVLAQHGHGVDGISATWMHLKV